MKRIGEQIKAGKVLVSDGAWGTFLQKRGLKPGECPELWCATHADVVLEIAESYVAAGADMIETNSFGGNRFKLEHYGLADRAVELNQAAAAISRKAAGPDRHVIASVGPTGRMLVADNVTEDGLFTAFQEQLVALEVGGADACCIETMSALDEAGIAVRAAKEATGLEIICTFTFEKNRRGEYRTMMGVSPAEMARAMVKAGADIIGSNCGNGMQQMVDIVRQIRQAAPRTPILVHANAGKPVTENGVTMFPENPEDMAAHVPEIVAAGAGIVGGCCGTTPDHIRAIAKRVRKLRS